jgi:hypothetical protein
MLRKVNVKMTFTKLAPPKKTSLGKTIIANLGDNTGTFPAPPVSTDQLTIINNNLIDAEFAAQTGDKNAKENLKQRNQEWDDAFKFTANYVNYVANGNGATITLAGFEQSKPDTSPAQKPGVANNFKAAVNGTKGNIAVSWDAVDSAKAFVVTALPPNASVDYNGDTMLLTIGDATVYVSVGTNRKVEISNVPVGTQLAVSVYAVNSAGAGPAANGQHVIAQ